MHAPSLLDVGFLLYLLVLLPIGGVRSAPLMRRPPADDEESVPYNLTRTQAMTSTIVMLVVTFVFSWIAAATRDYHLFAGSALGFGDIVAAVGALGLAIGVRSAVMNTTDEDELRIALAWLPRSSQERALGLVTVLAAGIAEEAAFRGVAVVILLDTLGVVWAAILLPAVAFAVAHAAQGRKATLAVFVFALAMHGLVWWTGGLLAAMQVHAVYDVIAGYLGLRLRRRLAPAG